MSQLLRKIRKAAVGIVIVFSLAIGVSRIANAATAIELTATGVYHAINAILTNVIDAGGIIGLDTSGQLSIQATRSGATVNVYTSTGTFAGTLSDKDGTVSFSGCQIIGDVTPGQ